MTKLKLYLQNSTGALIPITDNAVKILHDSLICTDKETLGIKMMLSLCLNGLEHEATQSIASLLKNNLEE